MKFAGIGRGETAVITFIEPTGGFSERLGAMGIRVGATVKAVHIGKYSHGIIAESGGALYAFRAEALSLLEVRYEDTFGGQP